MNLGLRHSQAGKCWIARRYLNPISPRLRCSPRIATCNATQYNLSVIKSFQHKGLRAFFERGTKAGIQPSHAAKLARQLAQLNAATTPGDMNIPGWRLHPLERDLAGHWAVWVNGNWRLTLRFEKGDAVLVNCQDDH